MLAQLSNRVQHALRAYTPAEQKAVKAAAQSFRTNPDFKTEDAILELGTGHALTSFLDEDGSPQVVQKTAIICPESLMGPCSDNTRSRCISDSPVAGKYDNYVDNESAYEVLEKQNAAEAEAEALRKEKEALEAELEKMKKEQEKAAEAAQKKAEREAEKKKEADQKKADRRKAKIESQLISTGGSLLKRGILGILKGKK